MKNDEIRVLKDLEKTKSSFNFFTYLVSQSKYLFDQIVAQFSRIE